MRPDPSRFHSALSAPPVETLCVSANAGNEATYSSSCPVSRESHAMNRPSGEKRKLAFRDGVSGTGWKLRFEPDPWDSGKREAGPPELLKIRNCPSGDQSFTEASTTKTSIAERRVDLPVASSTSSIPFMPAVASRCESGDQTTPRGM